MSKVHAILGGEQTMLVKNCANRCFCWKLNCVFAQFRLMSDEPIVAYSTAVDDRQVSKAGTQFS
jgi:hypothetical protein